MDRVVPAITVNSGGCGRGRGSWEEQPAAAMPLITARVHALTSGGKFG